VRIPNGPLRAALALLVIILLLTQWPASATATPEPAVAATEGPAPTDRLIIQLRAAGQGPQLAGALADVAGADLTYVRPLGEDAHVFALNDARPHAEVAEIARRLSTDPDVLAAAPDSLLFPALEPGDPLYQSFGWPLWPASFGSYGINLPAAWDLTTGDPNIVVAVLDTGGLLGHEDLAGRSLPGNPGYDLVGDLTRAGDGNGRDPDPSDPGDFVTSAEAAPGRPLAGCPVIGSTWHGSHVAGIIGATANNDRGLAGINWSSPLLHVRVLGKCGGYVSDIADGIRWAVGAPVVGLPTNPNPARVLNLSLGGPGTCNSFFQQAITQANQRGAVVVVAAGNSNSPAADYQPANCQGALTVASVGRSGWRAGYSNYGGPVAIAAPGGDSSSDTMIYSTISSGQTGPAGDSYYPYQGTSMAAPHIAGVASLMLSVNPALGPGELLSIMQATATPFPSGSSCVGICGSGIVNAGAAVEEAARLARILTTPVTSLAPRDLSFAAQPVGTTSPAQLTTLSNSGKATLSVDALSFEGDFARMGGSCPTTLPLVLVGGAGCTIGIAFSPTASGVRDGQMTIFSNAAGEPAQVALAGTGLAPAATLSPPSLSFGMQQVSSVSAPQLVTLQSSGDLPLTLAALSLSGPFTRTGGSCPFSFPANLAAGASCTIAVSFAPTAATRAFGTLQVSSDAPGPAAVALGGVGTAPALGFGPVWLSFVTRPLDDPSPAQSVIVTNPGTAPLALEAITLSGDYARVGGSCAEAFPASLDPGASCSVLISFTPRAEGSREGLLSVESDVPGGPYSVRLMGAGLSEPEPAADAAAAVLSLANLRLETRPGSVTLRFSVTRSGEASDELSARYIVTADRSVPDANLEVALAPVSFAPGETSREIEVTLDRLSLVAVRALAVSIEASAEATLAASAPLRIALPAEQQIVLLPLVRR
jgi:subtilisin family serine protease